MQGPVILHYYTDMIYGIGINWMTDCMTEHYTHSDNLSETSIISMSQGTPSFKPKILQNPF